MLFYWCPLCTLLSLSFTRMQIFTRLHHCSLAFSTLAADCFLFHFPDRLHLFCCYERHSEPYKQLPPLVSATCFVRQVMFMASRFAPVLAAPVALSANERVLCLFHTALGWLQNPQYKPTVGRCSVIGPVLRAVGRHKQITGGV